jgi:hypothetical protein
VLPSRLVKRGQQGPADATSLQADIDEQLLQLRPVPGVGPRWERQLAGAHKAIVSDGDEQEPRAGLELRQERAP